MDNKIYNKIKKYIRENFVSLSILFILVVMTHWRVNYYIITGGGTFDAKERVNIETKNKIKGSFSFSYVAEIKGTMLTYLLSYIMPNYERESIDNYKINTSETVEDINFRNSLMLKNANNNSLYVAYTSANKKIIEKSHKNYVYFITDDAKTNIKVGDEIISINGNEITDFKELRKYTNSLDNNEKVMVKVKRDNKIYDRYAYTFTKNNERYIGISIQEDIEYITDPKIKLKFKDTESGPSGGLILALQIYNMLVKKDITHGYDIAGTGTIDRDGNVGEIDGVKHKLRGAVKDHKEIFIVPSGSNYKEAIKEKKKNKYKIKIIEAKTFNDVLEKLDNLD